MGWHRPGRGGGRRARSSPGSACRVPRVSRRSLPEHCGRILRTRHRRRACSPIRGPGSSVRRLWRRQIRDHTPAQLRSQTRARNVRGRIYQIGYTRSGRSSATTATAVSTPISIIGARVDIGSPAHEPISGSRRNCILSETFPLLLRFPVSATSRPPSPDRCPRPAGGPLRSAPPLRPSSSPEPTIPHRRCRTMRSIMASSAPKTVDELAFQRIDRRGTHRHGTAR